jgi:hypothetical protein
VIGDTALRCVAVATAGRRCSHAPVGRLHHRSDEAPDGAQRRGYSSRGHPPINSVTKEFAEKSSTKLLSWIKGAPSVAAPWKSRSATNHPLSAIHTQA